MAVPSLLVAFVFVVVLAVEQVAPAHDMIPFALHPQDTLWQAAYTLHGNSSIAKKAHNTVKYFNLLLLFIMLPLYLQQLPPQP